MATPKKQTTETAQLAKEGTSAAKQEKTKAHMVRKSQKKTPFGCIKLPVKNGT